MIQTFIHSKYFWYIFSGYTIVVVSLFLLFIYLIVEYTILLRNHARAVKADEHSPTQLNYK